MKLADDIVTIRFGTNPGHIPLSDSKGNVTDLSGTAQVDYSTGTATIDYKLYGSVTAGVSSGTSSFPITSSGGQFTISYMGLSVSYTGERPTAINQASYTQNAIPSAGVAYDYYSASSGVLTSTPVCFAQGTRILVQRDGADRDVAVEELVVGDVAVTASGVHRSIRWIGSRTIDCRRYANRYTVLPVRIHAHALGENRPARDLVVSPGHALCVDVCGEALVPAIALVNDVTVVQEDVERITYWHVELDSHDLLLAENMAAESYLDMGNRAFFACATDGGAVVELAAALDADPAARSHADFCRPFHSSGPIVEAIRARMLAKIAETPRPANMATILRLAMLDQQTLPDAIVDTASRSLGDVRSALSAGTCLLLLCLTGCASAPKNYYMKSGVERSRYEADMGDCTAQMKAKMAEPSLPAANGLGAAISMSSDLARIKAAGEGFGPCMTNRGYQLIEMTPEQKARAASMSPEEIKVAAPKLAATGQL